MLVAQVVVVVVVVWLLLGRGVFEVVVGGQVQLAQVGHAVEEELNGAHLQVAVVQNEGLELGERVLLDVPFGLKVGEG